MLCYWLAFYLTRPVRKLQKAVERFGRGDLSARAESVRRDELGQLARTFDRMADRIETLLAAERRLLLDISHELRSPLARLGVAIELARSGDDTDSRAQSHPEGIRPPQLAGGPTAPGDARRGRPRLAAPRSGPPGPTGAATGGRFRDRSGGARLRVGIRTAEAVTVAGDEELLRRAVENVIRNAIRYAPRDTAVEVKLARDNGRAVVEVRDHGPGVPEDALPRLFDPFYRVESDRNRTSGGIGLGLSIARRAIELHKGRSARATPTRAWKSSSICRRRRFSPKPQTGGSLWRPNWALQAPPRI